MFSQIRKSNPKFARLAAVSSFVLIASAGAAAAATVVDGSFEDPHLTPGTYGYGVENPGTGLLSGVPVGLTFDNGSGIQSNGSAWGFAAAPAGKQTAFLQSYPGQNGQTAGVITQEIDGLVAGKTYSLSFEVANRPGYGAETLSAYVVGSASPTGTFTATTNSTNWQSETYKFIAGADGSADIHWSVASTPGVDSDIGLDNVSISAVPEPAAWALMLVGFAGLGGALRLRRKPLAAAI